MLIRIKILYILPYDTTYRYKTAFIPSLSYQPLTLSMLAALSPEDADITLVDEGVSIFDYAKEKYDIVGITICTSSAIRGYELADYFKSSGCYVLIGGHHATLLPEEALQHSDTVFIGSSEVSIPEFFKDYENDIPQKIYRQEHVYADKIPVPRRELMQTKGYLKQPTIIANYGCGNCCEYCVIHNYWGCSSKRPVANVIDEIKHLQAKELLFLDPSPLSDKAYAKELFSAMIPLGIKWAGLSSLDISEDDELLDLIVKSGCIGMLLGFESFNSEDLSSMKKYKNKVDDYTHIVQKMHDVKIAVLGAFMLGFDGDTKESIREMPSLIDTAKIDIPRYAILTPYPNTSIYEQLNREGRILHNDWKKYDSIHCVFKPKNMTADELEQEFLDVWDNTYTNKRIFNRMRYTPQRKLTALVTNIAFKIYAGRLHSIDGITV